jgi:TetR/AcrR family transcriptional regulator, lmrAB and yxaGH operons repressor
MNNSARYDPTRARLIAACLRLMQCHGYGGAGVAAILAEAHAPKGSLYFHFPHGKAGLAIAAIQFLEGEVEAHLGRLARSGLDLGQILRQLARDCGAWLETADFNQTPLLSAIAGGGAPPAVCAAAYHARTRWIDSLAMVAEDVTSAHFALTILEGGLAAARLSRDLALLHGPVELAARAIDQQKAKLGL